MSRGKEPDPENIKDPSWKLVSLKDIFGDMLEEDIAEELGRGDRVTSECFDSSGCEDIDTKALMDRFNRIIGNPKLSANDEKFMNLVSSINEDFKDYLENAIPREIRAKGDIPRALNDTTEKFMLAIGTYVNKLMEAHKMTGTCVEFLKDMDFGKALFYLKQGYKVARKGWNSKNMFLWLKPATTIKSEWCKDPMLKGLVDENGGELVALGTICMYTHDSSGRRAVLTGWLASQSDMLLEDWYVVE